MKKLLFFFSLFFIAKFVCYGDVYHKYIFEAPVYDNGVLKMKSCDLINKPFVPAIPVKAVRLLLDKGEAAEEYVVTYKNPVTLNEKFDLRPVSPSGRLSELPKENILSMKSEVFTENSFFPNIKEKKSFVTQYKNGHSIFLTIINPVQYNPISKEVKYFQEVEISVKTKSASHYETKNYKCNEIIKKHLGAIIDNKDKVKTLVNSNVKSDDYDYLIITRQVFEPFLANFTAFNTFRAFRTKVETVEDIAGEYSGDDLQDKIRNFIKHEYQNYNITYVLLVGDDDHSNPNNGIPHRGLRSEVMDYGTDYYDDTDVAGDLYYGCLDGTWKNDGSYYYGESGSEDMFFEVYVGRFPVDNSSELGVMTSKVSSYTVNPVTSSITNVLLLGEHLWGPPDFDTDTYGKSYMEELRGFCNANSYETNGIDDNFTISTLYDLDYGGYYGWGMFQLLQKINNEMPALINHLGHCNVSYALKLYDSDVNTTNFINNGSDSNYFVIYSQGCYAASFDGRNSYYSYAEDDCIAEAFLTISTGAVAYIGNSRYGFGSPYDTDGAGQRFHRFFYNGLFEQDLNGLEILNAYSKEINANYVLEEDIDAPPYYGEAKWTAYNLNVLGDPALEIWSSEPQTLSPNFRIVNSNLLIASVPYARILILSSDNQFLSKIIADESGNASLSNSELQNYINSNPNGSLRVFIKGENYYPYTANINIAETGIDYLEDKFYMTASPNPFNPQTTINYFLPTDSYVNLSIYNIKGELVKTLVAEEQTQNQHSISWDGKNNQGMDVTSGVYFYKISGKNIQKTNKLLLIK